MEKTIKICWISNVPSPYKVDLMNLLNERIELIALFESHEDKENKREINWYKNDFKFKVKYLSDINILQELKYYAKHTDLLINSDYSKPVCILASEIFNFYGKPTIMQADGGIPEDRGFFINKLMKILMNRNKFFLSSGKEVDKYFCYYGVDPTKIFHYRFSTYYYSEILNNQKLLLNKENIKKKLGMKEKIIVLSVGQQIHRKGYDVLARACVGLPESIKVIIAGGKPNEETKKIIENNNVNNINFIGFKDKKELFEYFAASDIFVLPTRYDIWGLVINEAMSFSLPIISTDKCVAAMEFMNKQENGIIVKVDDAKSLRKAIIDLVNDENKRKKLGEASFDIIKNYTLENMADDFAANIERILNIWKN